MKIIPFVKVTVFIAIILTYITLIGIHFDNIVSATTNHLSALLFAICALIVGLSVQSSNYLDILNPKNKIYLLPTLKIWALSNLANYIAPFQPGLIVRAKYFKSLGITYIKSSISVAKQLHYNLWISLALVGATLPGSTNFLFTLKIFLIILFLAWFPLLYFVKHILAKYLDKKWSLFSESLFDPPNLKQSILCLLHYLITALLFFILINEFELNIDFQLSILLAASLIISSFITITPNNIGVQEVIIGSYIHLSGAPNYEYITIPFMFRLAHIIACTSVFIILSLSLNRNINNT